MSGSSPQLRIEPRWPCVVAILASLSLLAALPDRIRLFPIWLPYVIGLAGLWPLAAARVTRGNVRWLRIEYKMTILFCASAVIANTACLANLIAVMIGGMSEVSGLQLLASSIQVWVTNVILFALLYWQIDRGGPEARANAMDATPDWLFPQMGAPTDVPPGWRPTFVDYLFLGYSTATAFSPTDALPLTARAKLLMMLESGISLATIVVVGARAINILGS